MTGSDGTESGASQKPPKGTEQWCSKEDEGGNIVKHGRWTQWHDNGKKAEEGQYRDGLKHGRWTAWSENGKKATAGDFRDDKELGAWTAWHENGQKAAELAYEDGKQSGPAVGWHLNGKKGVESNYKNGLQHGTSTTWHDNGQKSGEGEYLGGLEQGTWTSWDESGKTVGEIVYDGTGRSTTRAFDESGKVRAIMEKMGETVLRGVLLDENGKPEEVKEFEDGQLAKVTTYADGVETGSEIFRAGRWSVTKTTSRIDDSGKVYLTTQAQSSMRDWLGKEFTPLLVLECDGRKTEVVVQTGGPSQAELRQNPYARTVTLRFDQERPRRYTALQSTSQKALFLPRPIRLIKRMLEAEALLFQHTVSMGGDQTFAFDLVGLPKLLPKLQRACGWDD